LQIDRRVRLGEGEQPPHWSFDHPHFYRPGYPQANNSLYLATAQLSIPGQKMNRPGAGLFSHFSPQYCLTAPGSSRSIWQLPAWFFPGQNRPPLSYHHRAERWTLENDHVRLRSVGRGQEFVFDGDHYPQAYAWLAALL
jgi:hypothetical protein